MSERKAREEESRSTPEYMLTFGDMMNLLLCFFVAIIAQANFEEPRYQIVTSAIQGGLGILPGGNAIDVGNMMNLGMNIDTLTGTAPKFREDAKGVKKDLDKITSTLEVKLLQAIKKGTTKIKTDERGIVIQLTESIVFDSGSPVLNESASPVLDQIAEFLSMPDLINRLIRIEGHTDNIPVSGKFQSNWELSTMRAVNVLHYFEKKPGIKPSRMSAVGYGQFKPVAPNTTDEGRKANRRVEIVILKENVKSFE